MKLLERLEEMWFDFVDTGIPAFAIFVGLIALIVWKPIALLWILAGIGVVAIIAGIWGAFNFWNAQAIQFNGRTGASKTLYRGSIPRVASNLGSLLNTLMKTSTKVVIGVVVLVALAAYFGYGALIAFGPRM